MDQDQIFRAFSDSQISNAVKSLENIIPKLEQCRTSLINNFLQTTGAPLDSPLMPFIPDVLRYSVSRTYDKNSSKVKGENILLFNCLIPLSE